MADFIIIGIVVLIAVFAIGTLIKRSGRRGCCGSAGDYKPRKKKLKNIIATKEFRIDGMHCEKCSGRVMEVINDIPGVAGEVNLKTGIATVSYEQEVSDEDIKARIQRAGYSATRIH